MVGLYYTVPWELERFIMTETLLSEFTRLLVGLSNRDKSYLNMDLFVLVTSTSNTLIHTFPCFSYDFVHLNHKIPV